MTPVDRQDVGGLRGPERHRRARPGRDQPRGTKAICVSGGQQVGGDRGIQGPQRRGGSQRRHGAPCWSWSSCTSHSTSLERAAAELEMTGRVGALREPLGLDARLDPLDLADLGGADRGRIAHLVRQRLEVSSRALPPTPRARRSACASQVSYQRS